MSETTSVTFWKPKEDDAVLCERCGLDEMNHSLTVLLGLRPAFQSMQEVAEFYSTHPEAGPDYFQSSETGTCVECGEHR